MAKKASKKPRKPAASKKGSPAKARNKKLSGKARRRVLVSNVVGMAQPRALAAADAGPPASAPKTFKGTVQGGVVVFDAGSPPDGTRVEVNVQQNVPRDKTAVGFTLTLTRNFSVPPKPPIFELFDLQVNDQNDEPSELQSQNISHDQDLINSLLRRILNKDADVGWTFAANNGVITG
jgi:hypothetical protein